MQITDTPEQVATRRPPRSAPRFAGFKGDDSSTYVIYVDSRTTPAVYMIVKIMCMHTN